MDFYTVAETFSKLEKISERLEMMAILSALFKKADPTNIDKIVYLLQGRVSAPYTGIELGIGEKMAVQAIAKAYGVDKAEVERMYKEVGDLGIVAEKLCASKKQMTLFTQELTLERVYSNFYKIATAEGEGSQDLKIRLLIDILNSAKPLEARYVIRIPLGKLRLGVGDATILEALSLAVSGTREHKDVLENAYNVCSDLGYVAKKFFEEGLEGVKNIKAVVGIPIRPALAQRASSAQEIFERLGECSVEAKYDGFRCQIHRKGEKVWVFSRRLENMTHMFPEIVKGALEDVSSNEFIIEGEAIAFNENTGEFYPFQLTIQRKRKYGVTKMAEEYPLKLFAFDIIYLNGEDLRNKPYKERREVLEKVLKGENVFSLSEKKIARSAADIEKYFEEFVERGLEGIIAKDMDAPYIAGARKWAWIKLKRSYKGELSDTIDVVIVGYYKGRGHRAQFGLGGVLVAVYDPDADVFKTVAKVGTGFTEEQLKEMKETLDEIKLEHKHPRVIANIEADVWVEPKYVITVSADEITRSPMHTCAWDGGKGLALRFPRLVGWIRVDKGPEDATTEEEILEMYESQKKVSIE